MSNVNLEKLHVKFIGDSTLDGPFRTRKYTLTHSDRTGDLFLSIGSRFDEAAISGWYTRFMRDEVLAEFGDRQMYDIQSRRVLPKPLMKPQNKEDLNFAISEGGGLALHIYCHVSGGFVLGTARWRYQIFRHHMPGVIQALRYGDGVFIETHQECDQAPVLVHYQSTNSRYHKTEDWELLLNYDMKRALNAA